MDNFISTINEQLPKFLAKSLDKKVLLNVCDINKREKSSFSQIANRRQSNPTLHSKPAHPRDNKARKGKIKDNEAQVLIHNLQSQESRSILAQDSQILKKDLRAFKMRSSSQGKLPSLNKLTVELDYDISKSRQENFIKVQETKPKLVRKNKIEPDKHTNENQNMKGFPKQMESQKQAEQKQKHVLHFLFDYERQIKNYQMPSLRIQPIRNPSFSLDDPNKANINTVINRINEVEKKIKIKNNQSDRCSIAIPPHELKTRKIECPVYKNSEKGSLKEEIMKKYRLHLMKKVNLRQKEKQSNNQDNFVSAWNIQREEDLIYQESSLF